MEEKSGKSEPTNDDWRERMDRFEGGLEHLLQVSAKHDVAITSNEEAMRKLTQAQTDLTVTMNRLANIVIRHEERLDAIDGGDA